MNFFTLLEFMIPYQKLLALTLAFICLVMLLISGIVEAVREHKKIWKVEFIQNAFVFTIVAWLILNYV